MNETVTLCSHCTELKVMSSKAYISKSWRTLIRNPIRLSGDTKAALA